MESILHDPTLRHHYRPGSPRAVAHREQDVLRCSTKFGAPPNTQTCPVCIGMPGTLPVMNRRAVELSIKAAVALNCEIARFTKWDRKNYYYPDLPKGYQISQFDLPLSHDGRLTISDPKGESSPSGSASSARTWKKTPARACTTKQAGKADSRIDLNRAGTPLLEIVSQPDLRSPAEAKAYLTELKLLLNYLGVSDCNMQEGSLRVDANINLHIDTPQGKVATPIVEVKNMNSFRAVERAMDYEAQRQFDDWQRDRPATGRGAQVDPRLGRSRADHPPAARQGRIQRLSLFSRARPGAGHDHARRRSSRCGRRWANCRPPCERGWRRPTASRPTTAT